MLWQREAHALWEATSVGQDEDGVFGDAHLQSQLTERLNEVLPQLRTPPWGREWAVSRVGVGVQPPSTHRAQVAAGRCNISLLVLPSIQSGKQRSSPAIDPALLCPP